MTAPRRPTRLEQPLPGTRCAACWCPIDLQPRRVGICPRCYVLLVCLAPDVVQRLVSADLVRLAPTERFRIVAQQAHLITVASNAWRARVPPAPYRGVSGPYRPGQG